MREINAAIDIFEADAGVGAIVITGSEKAFAGWSFESLNFKLY